MLSGFPEIDTSCLKKATQAGHWIDSQLPQLQRRRALILASDGNKSAKRGLILYTESKFVSPAEAQRYGRSLANRLKKIHGWKNYKGVLGELTANKYDPDLTAAFFAELGEERSRKLPLELNRYDNLSKKQQIADLSDAFGTAVSAGEKVPGFSRVSRSMTRIDLSEDDVRGLAKLVSHGSFPPDWLAGIVQRQAIDPILTPQQYPVSQATAPNNFAAFMHALGNNPAAARLALNGFDIPPGTPRTPLAYLPLRPNTSVPTSEQQLARRIKALTQFVTQHPTQAKELGNAFAAATGTYDESDGNHSTEAARFTYTLMKTMGRFSDPYYGFPRDLKPFMSQIAGSYATEVTEGADPEDKNALQKSSFGKVKSAVPGLHPMFSLNPGATYQFLRTFADSPELMRPFNEGMGRLSQRLKALGVKLETDRKPSDQSPGMNRIMQALGSAAGLQLAAERKVQGSLDAQEEHSRKLLQKIVGAEFAAAGFAAPEALGAEILWEATMFSTESTIGDALDKVGNPRTEKLDKEQAQATLAAHYDLVSYYVDGKYKMTVSPEEFSRTHPSITDGSGHLLPFATLQKDQAKLRAFNEWLRANGMGNKDDDTTMGQSSLDASDKYGGAKRRVEQKALSGLLNNPDTPDDAGG